MRGLSHEEARVLDSSTARPCEYTEADVPILDALIRRGLKHLTVEIDEPNRPVWNTYTTTSLGRIALQLYNAGIR